MAKAKAASKFPRTKVAKKGATKVVKKAAPKVAKKGATKVVKKAAPKVAKKGATKVIKKAAAKVTKKAAKTAAKLPAATLKPASLKPERVRLGTLEITGDHVLVGDPSFLDGVGGDLLRSPSVPSGRFPVYADRLVIEGEERVGRLLLVFDEAKFEDAAAGRFAEPLDRLNVDAAMLCFLDGARADDLRRTVTLAGVWDALCRSDEAEGRRAARVPDGAGVDEGAQLIACIPGFGDGSYTLYWWYGEDVSSAPHQDIAALGVVTLAELDPWA